MRAPTLKRVQFALANAVEDLTSSARGMYRGHQSTYISPASDADYRKILLAIRAEIDRELSKLGGY